MGLFREVADSGKTVVCVTHTTANIERNCHLLVVLAEGGNLAFVGTPAEALGYFEVERVGDLYGRLAGQTPEAWRRRFLASPFHARYVAGRIPASTSPPAARPRRRSGPGSFLETFPHQARILTARYVRVTIRDHATLLTMLVQCLTVAGLLVLLFRGEPGSARVLSFLLAVASIWFGCNNSAKETVKERTVYSRERNVNLLATSYYFSKFSVIAALSVAQVSLLLGLVTTSCEVGPGTTFAREWMVVSALAVAGVALGLLISACARSEDQAVAIIPIALLPQLILGGGIAPLRDGSLVHWLARSFVATYWGFEAMYPGTPRGTAGLEGDVRPWVAISAQVLAIATLTILLLGSNPAEPGTRRRLGR